MKCDETGCNRRADVMTPSGYGYCPEHDPGPADAPISLFFENQDSDPNIPRQPLPAYMSGLNCTHEQAERARRGMHPTGRRLNFHVHETCRTCRHRTRGRERFTKCKLDRRHWTRGKGSDIRVKWPACESWQRGE